MLSRFPSTFAIIVEEVLGSTAVDNAPPQKSSDIRLRIFVVDGTGFEQGGSDDASRQSKQSAQWAVA